MSGGSVTAVATDGLSKATTTDMDGDGVADRTMADVTTVDQDGTAPSRAE